MLTKFSPVKHPKSNSIGGLMSNWEKVYQQSDPMASTTSLAASSTGDNEDENQPQAIGEFHEVDDVEIVREARKAKSKSQSNVKAQATNRAIKVEKKSITVELELANINEIDGKEHGKPKSRKTVWKFEDLPLPTAADVKLFKQNVVVPILDWTATLENLFSANSHSDLRPTVIRLWTDTFAHLPKYLDDVKKEPRAEHPVMCSVTGSVQMKLASRSSI
ncbi:uncharacterized protein EV420DRAFT_1655980 [Desarmillaria tabescens]|uniref:Uncharacterized protein n=1 Tax=Armillaria tabescens TaxID=1929756 RepID=A0AA39IX41_ARMTA|nr:uncharacterized protein EV420DRAFT_1655980 [Desarmillaria tabescens]KAK0432100.1 hypothetical protein EV420DRAFT_1655980 [Desarmillaria tabescens]